MKNKSEEIRKRNAIKAVEGGGLLINKAGEGRYLNQDAPGKVIHYITRTRKDETRAEDVIAWGARGASEYKGADGLIEEFKAVQKLHTRRGNFGRYIDHEIYSFSDLEQQEMIQYGVDIDRLARILANEFYCEGTQVVYAVHRPDKEDDHLHVHYAVNTVNFYTGNKRRENKNQTKEKGKRMRKLIKWEIQKKKIITELPS